MEEKGARRVQCDEASTLLYLEERFLLESTIHELVNN
jgi:hypothetical protein